VAKSGGTPFEESALPHLPTLYRAARKLTRNAHEAEDLVQETCLKAFRAYSRYEEREMGILPWLLRIMRNTNLNRVERTRRAPKIASDVSLDLETAPQSAVEHEWSEATGAHLPPLDFDVLDEEVKSALESLSPEFREVIVLWSTNELSYQDIAVVLGTPVGTVMSRLHRARNQLVRLLAGYADEHRIPNRRKSE
jgi:RNA polymerase sigma-70 factor (ECF subfamily)